MNAQKVPCSPHDVYWLEIGHMRSLFKQAVMIEFSRYFHGKYKKTKENP